MKNLITYTLCALLATQSIGKGIGNGSDGVASISGIVNKYAAVTTFSSQATFSEFTVDTASAFSAGDLVLLIQMQGIIVDTTNSVNYGTIQNMMNTGNYEYVIVSSVINNTIRTTKFKKQYDGIGKIQLVKVPQYKTATLTGNITGIPWNGEKGGIIAIDVTDTLIMQANIVADGMGFRGGIPKDDVTSSADDTNYVKKSPLNGMKGEGIAGRGDDSNVMIYGRGSIANGGGGSNNHNAGGGGGANAGCGGLGGWGYYSYQQPKSRGIGGLSLAADIESGKIFLGGGGGAGQANDNFLSIPGNGGGIVILTSGTIAGNSNNVAANGTNGSNINGYDGAAGGGAGGTILVYADVVNNLNVTCNGGKGGNPKNFFNQHLTAPGGGGSGGAIRIKSQATLANVTKTVDKGDAGICDTSNYGATAGCPGIVFETLEIEHPPVGIKDLAQGKLFRLNMSLSPNPARDYVELQLVSGETEKTELAVYDATGRKHYSTVFTGNRNRIDISQWTPGIYLFKVVNSDGTGVSRIIK